MESFDIAFLGGGPAGYTGAIKAARCGKKVLLIEQELLGGVCLNKGCVPTKSIISSLKVAQTARRGKEFGLHIPTVDINFHDILLRKERIVSTNRKGIEALLKKHGVTVLRGRGRIVEAGLLEVNCTDSGPGRYKADNVIICTGSTPASLPGVAHDSLFIFNSDSLFNSEDVEGRVLIIGGGAIGCEYAYIFNRLGIRVTVAEVEPHLLPREDDEVAKSFEREFKKKGIKIVTGERVTEVETLPAGVKVLFEKSGELEVDKVLVSVGRVPCSHGIGLENIGIKTDERGAIGVNLKMETEAKGFYAAGDVTGRFQLAYTATHEALTAVENIIGHPKEMSYNAVPRVIFSDPEVGCVGLTESDAKERGMKVKIGTFHYRGLGRAHASGEMAGLAKVIANEADDRILGVHIIGANASELVHTGCFMIKNRLTTREASEMLFAHPVFSEVISEALWDVHGESIHKL